MGAVYLGARDDDEFKKRVAIKLLKRGTETDDVIARFRTERQILASVDHPNIGRLIDGGATEDGLPYFIMEYIEGQSIDQYCDSHRLSTTGRLKLFRKVCGAVHFAHQNLIVHRDLKPKNILVTAQGEPKLLDFGIAKLLNPDMAAVSLQATVAGVLLMTPQYASPEQVRGEPITTASDIYSLGVILYELLTGHFPYQIKAKAMHEIVKVISEQEPTRPSTAITRVEKPPTQEEPGKPATTSYAREGSSEKLRRRLSGDLDNIVLMAMRKEPERRYKSVDELSEDIRRHLEGLPVIAREDTFGYRAQKFVLRHKGTVAAAALVVISLAVAAVVSTWQAGVAAEERDRARVAAEKAEQINLFVQEMLASADPSDPDKGGRDVTVAEVLDRAAARVKTELDSQPEVQTSIQQTIGLTYMGLGLYAEAEEQLGGAYDTLRQTLGDDHPDTALSLHNLASLEALKGELDRAETMFRDVLEIQRETLGSRDPKLASTLSGLASVIRAKGDFDDAEGFQREALGIRREAFGKYHWDVANSLNNLGVTLGTRGDFAAAEPLHREALEILRRVRGPDDPTTAAVMAALGFDLDNQGEYEEAEELYRESLAIRTRVLGEEHPDAAWSKYNYASFLHLRGNYEQSERLSRQILELRGTTLPDSHAIIGATLLMLGQNLMAMGNAAEAEPWIRESIAVRRRVLAADHWMIASAKSSLGECLTKLGRFGDAEPLLLSSADTLEEKLGENHARTLQALEAIGKLYEAWQKPDKAAPYRARSSQPGEGSR